MEIAKYSEFDKASYNEAYQFKNEIELYKDFNAELAVNKTVEEAKKITNKTVESGHHQNYFQVDEVAKTLALRDSQKKLIGRNRMIRCLRYNKILDKKNAPYQFYLNMDLTKYHSVSKRYKRYLTPLFSEAGIDYLNQRFINGKFIVNVDYVKRVTERKKVLRTLDEVC